MNKSTPPNDIAEDVPEPRPKPKPPDAVPSLPATKSSPANPEQLAPGTPQAQIPLPKPKPPARQPETTSQASKSETTPPASPPEAKPAIEPESKPQPPIIAEEQPPATGEECRAALGRLGASFAVVSPPADTGNCSIANPVRLDSLRVGDQTVRFSGAPLFNCNFARQFATWVSDIALPVVAFHENSALAAISANGFQCRGRNGEAGAKMSEHASGNAVDVDSLLLRDGTRIAIPEVADQSSAHRSTLMALRVSACGYFTTVLGPGADAAHASHYHFDLGLHGKSANYRICE